MGCTWVEIRVSKSDWPLSGYAEKKNWQKAHESLAELDESMQGLVHLANPTAPREVTEMIAKD